ncbi:MAG: class I SAM-dependent methyltransferase [Candidatus Heimdallarchaeaceae archaeon]
MNLNNRICLFVKRGIRMKSEQIKKLVIKEFSGENAQKKYIAEAERGLWNSEKEFINKYFKKKRSILDIGCGTGRTTLALYRLGYDVIGIDIVPKMIDNARKIARQKGLSINYSIGDATNLNFKDDSFDYAFFSNQGWTQIPGKENRQNAMNEVYRILISGGIYIFTAHTRKWLSKRFFYWVKMWIKHYILRILGFKIDSEDFGDIFFERESGVKKYEKQYIHICSVKEVKKNIKKAGFTLIENKIGLSEQSGTKPMFFVCKK